MIHFYSAMAKRCEKIILDMIFSVTLGIVGRGHFGLDFNVTFGIGEKFQDQCF